MTPSRVALIMIAICGVAAWQVTVIPESAIQMAVGPVLVPAVIVGALTLFRVALARFRAPHADRKRVWQGSRAK